MQILKKSNFNPFVRLQYRAFNWQLKDESYCKVNEKIGLIVWMKRKQVHFLWFLDFYESGARLKIKLPFFCAAKNVEASNLAEKVKPVVTGNMGFIHLRQF